jgi:enoyl-CoA hydratase
MRTTMLDQTIDGVRTITLQREPMNTLDLTAVRTLRDRFAEHPRDMPLVLAGANGVFCAGVDAKAFMGYAPVQRLEMAQAITQMTAHLLAISAPVVASITGHALGGGFVLALCCDYRIATDAKDAKFGLFEAKAGIAFPSGPALIVQRELPAPLLRHMTLACRSVSGNELLRHVVFDELVHADQIDETARQRATQLALLSGFRAVKSQMRAALAHDVRRLAEAGREEAFEP